VPGWGRRMATEAEVRAVLEFQQMPVGRPMNFVADGAALDLGRPVLVNIRPTLIGMALETRLLLESTQPPPGGGFMGVMAGCAGEDALLESVAFVELEFREDILVAGQAIFIGAGSEEVWRELLSVDSVAACAVERGPGMRACGEARTVFCMAC